LDTERLGGLYRDFGYAVHRRCLGILGNGSDAEDVLQDVFIRAMRYIHTFDGKNPLGWLLSIANRQCIDTIKKRRRLTLATDAHPGLLDAPLDSLFSSELQSGCDARLIIRSAKRKDAEAAILCYVDEMTQDEAAEEMGCSRKTIKKRLKRFKSLGRALSAASADEGNER
jgi:RNA polymerase sigma-70 factor (ECF subfamily)